MPVDFVVGEDDFQDIRVVRHNDQCWGFLYAEVGEMVRFFVLRKGPQVDHVCQVTLIQKEKSARFTPRLAFSTRKHGTDKMAEPTKPEPGVKARVDLGECHENHWALISFLKSLKELDVPDAYFSLTPSNSEQIKAALSEKDAETIAQLTRLVIENPTFSLSVADAVQLNLRRSRLQDFQAALGEEEKESWWQDFFEDNQWIFGYGLKYQIIRVVQPQANLGGAIFTGSGARRGDFLGATSGDARFTVVVEIKTPGTPLLQGDEPQRNGAWSLTREFTDAVTQAQAYANSWAIESQTRSNTLELAKRKLLVVHPKAIVVIGCLTELLSDETKASTFQLFRESLHGIEVLTFDELLERAKFIVEHMQQATPK